MPTNDALDPQSAMDLVETTSRAATRSLRVDDSLLFLAWGAAWILGYGATFLSIRNQDPYHGPAAWAYVVLAASLGLAAVFTGVTVSRTSRGIAGASATSGLMYGLSWPVGFVTLFSLEGAIAKAGASDAVQGLVGAAGPALLVGVIYVVGAAIWRSTTMFALGAWLCLVVAIGGYAGVVGFAGLMAVAGGGGFVLAGTVMLVRARR